MPASKWNVELPTRADLPALPKGVVVHWTGGGNRANAVDLAAYHFVVELDGTVKRGKWQVAANMRKLVDDKYAKHTGGFNSFRVGISAAGMKDYLSRSSRGSFPLTEVQVRRMMEVAAYFIDLAELDPLNPSHLCSHREVWTLHGIKGVQNDKKTDIEFLPFRTDLKPAEVGPVLRQMAADSLEATRSPAIVLPDPLVVAPEFVAPEPSIAAPEARAERIPITTPVTVRGSQPIWWQRLLERVRS